MDLTAGLGLSVAKIEVPGSMSAVCFSHDIPLMGFPVFDWTTGIFETTRAPMSKSTPLAVAHCRHTQPSELAGRLGFGVGLAVATVGGPGSDWGFLSQPQRPHMPLTGK
jgi:hypothetical protein